MGKLKIGLEKIFKKANSVKYVLYILWNKTSKPLINPQKANRQDAPCQSPIIAQVSKSGNEPLSQSGNFKLRKEYREKKLI